MSATPHLSLRRSAPVLFGTLCALGLVSGCDSVGSLGPCVADLTEGSTLEACTARRCNRGIITKDMSTGVTRLFCTKKCNPSAATATGCADGEWCYTEATASADDSFCALTCADPRCKAPLVCQAGSKACY